MPIRLIKHEAVPKCGSFEVRFPDGKPSRHFYWEDEPSRRLREQMTSEQALKQTQAFAGAHGIYRGRREPRKARRVDPVPPDSPPLYCHGGPPRGWRPRRQLRWRRGRLSIRSRPRGAYVWLMPRKPIELPPAAARSFVRDMRAFHETNDSIKRDEIAARQAWLLSEHLGPSEKKLRAIDVRQMFVDMKDHV
jgi:hypothetical protein